MDSDRQLLWSNPTARSTSKPNQFRIALWTSFAVQISNGNAIFAAIFKSAPGVTRTPDLRIRNPLLYPAELRAQNCGRKVIRLRVAAIVLRLIVDVDLAFAGARIRAKLGQSRAEELNLLGNRVWNRVETGCNYLHLATVE